ncbi:ribonuclease P protein component [Gephyromycinifex aptenodytis]|uniref:ribonuclease P protein component n=1 Tax=Gephyromycinifex aptenodytis TaxID=2716227 RepID=UPI0014485F04|nr:ribonuclease P protein component [Gephyromycinifex aptenodytis]
MLPSVHRLRDHRDFAAASRGRRAGSPLLVVHAHPCAAGTVARVGFVVSRKVGNSVVRNRVKRRLRALMAAHLEELPAGYDIVVRANPAAAQADYLTLGSSLAKLLPRVLQRPQHFEVGP